MRILTYLFLLIIILLGASFALLNSNVVDVNYFFGHKAVPVSLLIVSVFAVGSVLGMLMMVWLLIKEKMQNHHLQKQLKLAQKEIENLRAIPLQDKH